MRHTPSPGASTARMKGSVGLAQGRREAGTLHERLGVVRDIVSLLKSSYGKCIFIFIGSFFGSCLFEFKPEGSCYVTVQTPFWGMT